MNEELGVEEFDLDSAVEEVAGALGGPAPEVEPAGEEVKEEVVAAPAPAEEEQEGEEGQEGEAEVPPEGKVPAPKTWRKEAAEAFSTLPKVVQDEVLKREDDIFKGIEQYKSDAGFGQRMRASVERYLPVLERYGIPVEAQVAATMDAHYRLALGSQEEKLAVMQQIVQDYGIDAARLVSEVGMVSPEVSELQTKIRMLESRLQMDERQQAITRQAEVERQIVEFSTDPANEHFELVVNDMAAIIRGAPGTSLKDAYSKAVWANPQTRELELAKQRVEAEAKTAAAAKARAAKVKGATAANVKTSAKSGSAAAPIGTMDDTLKAAYANLTGSSGG